MHRLTKSMIPAALIGALAGAASGQFVAEGQRVAQAAEHAPQNSVQTIVQVEDGSKAELRIENGVIVLARVDGEDWPKDRIKHHGERVILLGKDGQTVRTFTGASPNPPVQLTVQWDRNPQTFVPAAVPAPRVMLGITYSDPGEALRAHLNIGDKPAMQVDSVVDDLPAARSGLKRHDIIVSINGSDGADAEILRKALADAEPGDRMELLVRRGGQTLTLRPELAAYDASKLGIGPARGVARIPAAPATPAPPARPRVFPELNLDIDLDADSPSKIREAIEAQLGEMRKRFDELQRDATRQTLEMRDGRVFIRSADEINRRLDELQRGMAERAPEVRARVEDRIRLMEERMEHIERTFESRIDRLTALLERMADRLDQGAARQEERKNP